MKFVYLPSAVVDLEWYVRYYSEIFPQGEKEASKHFREARLSLETFPLIGEEIEHNMRKFPIKKTHFMLMYKVIGDEEIQVYRVKDTRGKRND